MREAHERSIYADIATFDEVEAQQLCMRTINRHGHPNYGGTLFLLSVDGGHVLGFLIGFMDKVYPCLKELMATDLAFYFSDQAEPRDAAIMVGKLGEWAIASPKCIELHLGVTAAVGDWERIGKLYEHLGLERCGGMWRRTINRPRQEAANE